LCSTIYYIQIFPPTKKKKFVLRQLVTNEPKQNYPTTIKEIWYFVVLIKIIIHINFQQQQLGTKIKVTIYSRKLNYEKK